MVNSFLYQIRCLGRAETSKSATSDGKQLFISDQVFRKYRVGLQSKELKRPEENRSLLNKVNLFVLSINR